MIIIMSVTYLYGQALEMDVAKTKTWFKVIRNYTTIFEKEPKISHSGQATKGARGMPWH